MLIVNEMLFEYNLSEQSRLSSNTSACMAHQVSDHMAEWRDYEKQIHEKFRIYFPTCKVIHNTTVRGRFSKTPRQVDIAVQSHVEGFHFFGAVECKYFNKRVDVKIVDSFIGFLDDIGADFGYIITNKGFTKSAANRASVPHLRLRVVEFNKLGIVQSDLDDLINQRIQALDCIEPVFLIRQQERSKFIDLPHTSLSTKTIVFKEGFADTQYFAHKKLLEETARVFRDFSCIDEVTVIIPAARESTIFCSSIKVHDFEAFLHVDVTTLRRDIKLWRQFLGSIKKPLVEQFAEKYVSRNPYQ